MLVEIRWLALHPEFLNQTVWEGQRMCISNRIPAYADVAGLWLVLFGTSALEVLSQHILRLENVHIYHESYRTMYPKVQDQQCNACSFWSQHSARFSREDTGKADPTYHWHPILHDPPTLLHVPALPSHLDLSKFKAGLCLHIFAHGFSSLQDALSHFPVASSFKMLFPCWIPLYHFPLRRLCPSSRKLFPSRKLQFGVGVINEPLQIMILPLYLAGPYTYFNVGLIT